MGRLSRYVFLLRTFYMLEGTVEQIFKKGNITLSFKESIVIYNHGILGQNRT